MTKQIDNVWITIKNKGFTLIELMLTVAIVSIIASISYASYRDAIEKAEIAMAISDIVSIEQQMEQFYIANMTYPASLAVFGNPTDPWGNPYQYLNMAGVKGNGPKRKDKNLVPLNSDYDLYSSGPDGNSVSALTAQASKDDIIRANNGGFIGKAEDY